MGVKGFRGITSRLLDFEKKFFSKLAVGRNYWPFYLVVHPRQWI